MEALGDAEDFVHLSTLAVEVYGQKSARALARCRLDLFGRDVVGARLDVNEARARADARDCAGGGEEGEGGCDDLLSSAYVERHEREQDGVRAGGAADGVLRVRVARQFPFEQAHVLAEYELLRVEHALDGRAHLVAKRGVLLSQVEKGDVHGLLNFSRRVSSLLRNADFGLRI